eukprot:XP_001706568.1 Hypothetical protein GL50803_90551 [Giardia lamblia ATCC 50803]
MDDAIWANNDLAITTPFGDEEAQYMIPLEAAFEGLKEMSRLFSRDIACPGKMLSSICKKSTLSLTSFWSRSLAMKSGSMEAFPPLRALSRST